MSLFAPELIAEMRGKYPQRDVDLIIHKIEARNAMEGIRNPQLALLAYLEHAERDDTERLDRKGGVTARKLAEGEWIARQRERDRANASDPDYAAFRGALIQRVLAEALTPRQVGETLAEYQRHFPQILDAELERLAAAGDQWQPLEMGR